MRLRELQEIVSDVVRRETPVADDPVARDHAARLATGSARLTAAAQIEVYREQFWLRHVASLLEDFPTVELFLGAEGFRALVTAYLRAHPPDTFSLRDLGADLPRFLRASAPYSADALLGDCADVEWAFIEAYDAPDAPPLDPHVIASMPEDAWPRAVIVFQPALRLLALAHAAHDLRALVRAGEKPARPSPRETKLVVFRRGELLQYLEVEPLAFHLLEELHRGTPLERACEIAAGGTDGAEAELESRLAGWFQSWASYGWISRVSA